MESRHGVIKQRIVRPFNNNLLQVILEFIGLQLSLKTIFKTNSNFKGFVKHIYNKHLDHISEFKKLLFENKSRNVKKALGLFNSFFKNRDENWHYVGKLMSNLFFTNISFSNLL
jgi:hypothetical protein